MSENNIMEIVSFNNIDGISKNDFVQIVDGLENNFHKKQDGFVSTVLLAGRNDNEWIIIQHWDSKDNAVNSSKKLMTDQRTTIFRNSIDPKSVKMFYHELIAQWTV